MKIYKNIINVLTILENERDHIKDLWRIMLNIEMK